MYVNFVVSSLIKNLIICKQKVRCFTNIVSFILWFTASVVLMVSSVLVSSAVDRGFEPRSEETKDYKHFIGCFSAEHTVLRRKNTDWLARNRDIVSVWSIVYIYVDCCFSELGAKVWLVSTFDVFLRTRV